MSPATALRGAAFAVALLVAGPAVAQPASQVHLADGHDWMHSSPEQRRAYLAGVSNIPTAS